VVASELVGRVLVRQPPGDATETIIQQGDVCRVRRMRERRKPSATGMLYRESRLFSVRPRVAEGAAKLSHVRGATAIVFASYGTRQNAGVVLEAVSGRESAAPINAVEQE